MMAQQSKYSNEQVEAVVDDLLSVLKKHDTPIDLALMCLGDTTSHLLNSKLQNPSRTKLAEQFANILVQSSKD